MSSPTPSTSSEDPQPLRTNSTSDFDPCEPHRAEDNLSSPAPPTTQAGPLSAPLHPRSSVYSDHGLATFPSSASLAKRNSRLPDPPFLRERTPYTAPSTPTMQFMPGSDSPVLSQRGSMILYRFADDKEDPTLEPPRPFSERNARASVWSSSGDSIRSMDYEGDSKYPSGVPGRGLVPYVYDPDEDHQDPLDDEDVLHDPTRKDSVYTKNKAFPWRGIANFSSLLALIVMIMCLFILYPVWIFYHTDALRIAINENVNVNKTGQVPVLFQMPSLIDKDTPENVKTRTGFDGEEYVLVFSDEFNVDGRTFYPGEDPYWEAVNLWYGVTEDLEWYDPSQVTTRDGALIITMDADTTIQPNLTPNSTAPFPTAENHQLSYKSGMLQSWNKFCFTSGYIEVAVSLPGASTAQGFWPGVWTMGNLARPGYQATSDGMWPYTYDSCDVGTLPNQTNVDGQTPTAAVYTDQGQARYNNELSWLPGQRVSACTCPGSEHPGPSVTKGRGAPEIDIFEARREPSSGAISQSAQFAPFTHDYDLNVDTTDNYEIFDAAKTHRNTFAGSAKQQSTSTISNTAADGYQLGGDRLVVYGFEYWSDPNDRGNGFISWASDGVRDVRLGAGALGPDPEAIGGTGVSQRLISEEPMSIVMNIGISESWQEPQAGTLTFPAEMRVDYVRVYQRKDHENIGCDPQDYPTAEYIANHLEAYTNPNVTVWNYPMPVNSLANGGC